MPISLDAAGRARGIAITDALKADAIETIGRMKDTGLETMMISGDKWRAARAVAAQLGIEEVMAEVLPDEKVGHVWGL